MSRIKFMNTEVDNLTMDEAIAEIDRLIQDNRNSYVVTPNVDHIVKLEKDKELQLVYKNADLILTDGKPLLWISRLYKNPIKEKVSGSDLFPRLCALAAQKGYTMFFLGAAEGVAAKAAENLMKRFPELKVIDTYSPPYGFDRKEEQLEYTIRRVKDAKPDILIVALGCPKQEKFIYRFRNDMNVPVSLGLGASIDFEAGNIKRAPQWMRNIGLEWLHRMLSDPKRLIKRYLIDDLAIIRLIFKYRKDTV